jgi:hypothetical protein
MSRVKLCSSADRAICGDAFKSIRNSSTLPASARADASELSLPNVATSDASVSLTAAGAPRRRAKKIIVFGDSHVITAVV